MIASIPTLVLVSVIVFAMVRLQPGDVIVAQVADAGTITPEIREQIEAELGLDKHPVTQYFVWLGDVVRGDLGMSFQNRQPVIDRVLRRAPVSIELMLLSIVVALAVALPLGVAAAYWRGSFIDYLARGISVVGLSMPDFFFAMVVIILLVTQFQWLPPLTYKPFTEDPVHNLSQFAIPALIVGYRYASITARMTRSAMLEVLNNDFVRTARAKGLGERQVVLVHAAKNATIPVMTVVGTQMIALFSSLVVIEIVFVLPGLGSMTYQAVLARDYPVVQAAILLFATATLAINIVVDLLYAVFDPRIRYS